MAACSWATLGCSDVCAHQSSPQCLNTEVMLGGKTQTLCTEFSAQLLFSITLGGQGRLLFVLEKYV